MSALSYSFRSSTLVAERHYDLGEDRLSWTGDKPGSLDFRSIAKVKVYQKRFWGSSRSYWTCILYSPAGGSIHLSAAHRVSMRITEDRTASYIPFIKELEARIAAANPSARFVRGRGLLSFVEGGFGWLAVRALRIVGLIDCERSANALAWAMGKLGPRLRGHRLARAQLNASFPDKNAKEIDTILDGVWDNIGRVAAEYAHLRTLWDFDPARPDAGRIIIDPVVVERLQTLGQSRVPALMFGSHQANWELLGLAARAYGRDIVLVYREPKVAAIADEIVRLRGSGVAGLIAAGPDTPLRIRNELKQNRLVGMLVDQYDARGVDVVFFGRTCKVSATLGRMARLADCPLHGARVVRLPDRRYRLEMTDPITPPHDHEGRVDVAATMQMVTTMIEGWVREHPEQWMWTHRRWRE